MSGETEKAVSGWTVDTIHSLMLSSFAALEKSINSAFVAQERAVTAAFIAQETAMAAALAAQEKAVAAALAAADRAGAKAETAAEKRFDGINELRQMALDAQANFLPRGEAEIRFASLSEKMDILASQTSTTIGWRGGSAASHASIFSALGIAAGLIGAVLGHFIR